MNQKPDADIVHLNGEEVTWRVEQDDGRVHHIPWGRLWLGKEAGGGQIAWVESDGAFQLTIQTSSTTFVEFITPGSHRILLTDLDRTDVRPGADLDRSTT